MTALGRYILSVTAAGVILSILPSLLEKKSSAAVLVRLIGGLFLTLTAIAPVADIDFNSIFEMPGEYTVHGNVIASNGQIVAQEQLLEIIKERSEAYILDKAMSYQTPMEVEVILSQDEIPAPSSVRLKGSISPYVKGLMMKWLQAEMGIPQECQIWIG